MLLSLFGYFGYFIASFGFIMSNWIVLPIENFRCIYSDNMYNIFIIKPVPYHE
jgi:hypothetical protein